MKETQKSKYLLKVGREIQNEYLFESDDIVEIKNVINKYISKNIKKCYYTRHVFYEKHIMIDYGSWTNFIFVYFKDDISKQEYIGEEMWKELTKKSD